MLYDCAVIGGGPAGLSAALVLGRARRTVLVIDDNKPRNAVTKASHGLLTRDGISPSQLKEIAIQELAAYPAVTFKKFKVERIMKVESIFFLETIEGERFTARKILFASGIKEELPKIKGIETLYGKSLFSCPYCDGWEIKSKKLAIISKHPTIYSMAKLIYNWSKDLIICTDGQEAVNPEKKQQLEQKGILIYSQKIERLIGEDGMLERIRFVDGTEVFAEGGFITPEWKPNSQLAKSLGCEIDEHGGLNTDSLGRTNVNHVYAAGDITTPSQIVIAAGEGTKAAIGINSDLINEDFAR